MTSRTILTSQQPARKCGSLLEQHLRLPAHYDVAVVGLAMRKSNRARPNRTLARYACCTSPLKLIAACMGAPSVRLRARRPLTLSSRWFAKSYLCIGCSDGHAASIPSRPSHSSINPQRNPIPILAFPFSPCGHRRSLLVQTYCFETKPPEQLPEDICAQGGRIAAFMLARGKHALTSRVLKVK